MVSFINRYGDQKVFRFFRNNPHELLSFDKILRDKASREGKSFDLPILSSMQPLSGSNSNELKKQLLHKLFTKEHLKVAKSEDVLRKSIEELDPDFLARFLGEGASNKDLEVFCTPAGQIFFYWLYQSLNLHLISEDPATIQQINLVKKVFAETLVLTRK